MEYVGPQVRKATQEEHQDIIQKLVPVYRRKINHWLGLYRWLLIVFGVLLCIFLMCGNFDFFWLMIALILILDFALHTKVIAVAQTTIWQIEKNDYMVVPVIAPKVNRVLICKEDCYITVEIKPGKRKKIFVPTENALELAKDEATQVTALLLVVNMQAEKKLYVIGFI